MAFIMCLPIMCRMCWVMILDQVCLSIWSCHDNGRRRRCKPQILCTSHAVIE